MIARHIARYGIKAKAENVLMTSGSQQALDLIGKLLINAGDRVLVEAPTYLGALQAFNVYGAEYISVPSDEDGLRTDLLDTHLRTGPKFMYVLPNFQNPGGTTLSLAKARAAFNRRRRVAMIIRSLGARCSNRWSVIGPMLSVTAWSWAWMPVMPV